MKEKLEQEIRHLKQRIDRKKKISRRLSLIALLWFAPVLLGFILFEFSLESLGNKIGFAVWILVVLVLILIVTFWKEYLDRLKKRLRRAEKKLNLKNFLDELEATTDSENKKMLVEKILKEAE